MTLLQQISQEHIDTIVQAAQYINQNAASAEKSYVIEVIMSIVGTIVTGSIFWGIRKIDGFLVRMSKELKNVTDFVTEKKVVLENMQSNCVGHKEKIEQHTHDINKLKTKVYVLEDHAQISHI